MGAVVEYATDGGTARGWLARPGANATGKGVVVCHEYWGLTDQVKDVTERVAAAGYVAFAIDLWDGQIAPDAAAAYARFIALDLEAAADNVRGALAGLRAEGVHGKLGIVGFCLGGQLALAAACDQPDDVGACVTFYGVHPRLHPRIERLAAPVLGIFGKRDPHVTPAHAVALERELVAAGKSFTALHYDADHAFFNATRPEVYDEDCADDAWKRTIAFFADHL